MKGVGCKAVESKQSQGGRRQSSHQQAEGAVSPRDPFSSPGGWAPTRLVGSRGSCASRVELFHQGVWGMVWDDLWDLPEADTACRQLGYGWAASAPGEAHFGEGSGKVLLDSVHCSGEEQRLEECSHVGCFAHNCGPGGDAGVICSGTPAPSPGRAPLGPFQGSPFQKTV